MARLGGVCVTSLGRRLFDSLFATCLLPSFILSSSCGPNDHSPPSNRGHKAQTASVWFLIALPSFWLTHTHTETHTSLFVQLHACKCAHWYTHQSNPHACTHRHKHTDACTHPGVPWRLVRCAVLQDWIISQLWVGQPRICPNPRHSVQIASHTHAHTPIPAPAQQRALPSLFCLFAPVFLHFLSTFPCLHPASSPPVLWAHIPEAIEKTAPHNLWFGAIHGHAWVEMCVFAYVIVSMVNWDLCAYSVFWTGGSWACKAQNLPWVMCSPWNQASMCMRMLFQDGDEQGLWNSSESLLAD